MLLNIIKRGFTATEMLTDRWLGRIKDLSKTNESRELYSQLSSLLEYYNMNIQEEQRKVAHECRLIGIIGITRLTPQT